ncbi:tetratricopeptide repeat protein [Flavobacterium flavigenum]|uniref:tetratricopeptide repeat protein n=1 Tax=Flavobacterium flavigenum TaxID=3003258 RepID=UPI0022ABFA82|nr:tetratricopeptide repeat protein [Flavobacterium flavigenum]
MKLPFIIKSLLLLTIVRGIVVILHELGHAIPAIILTKQKVSIYIGSYGNPKKSINFRIGLLDVWLSYEMLSWKNGLCVPSAENISINRQIIYVLTGPICSSIFATLYLYVALFKNFSDLYLHFAVIFFLISILDLFGNLIPNENPIELFDGTVTYNDGYTLSKLFKYRKFPNQYTEAIDLFNKKEYKKSINLFDYFLKVKLKDENIYRLNMFANMQIKNFERAKELFDNFEQEFKLTSDDYSNGGLIYSKLNMNNESLHFYNKSIELNAENVYSLNNKGFTLTLLEKYSEAIPLFDKAIEIDEFFAYSYNNRGLSKIKTGRVNEGLADIEKSIKLDENNSYSYRNLGIYHFDIGEIEKARELFLKSKELDGDTHMIDELILSTSIS